MNLPCALFIGMWGAGLTMACSGTFRFDDHSLPRDAGGASDSLRGADAMSDGSAVCDAGTCDFIGQPCGGDDCTLHCPHGNSCTGLCESGCTADCEENSICSLTAGQGADLECEPDARCSFVVGRAGRIECRSDSDCGTRCLESCTISCAPGATCALACGDTQPFATVSGMATCP